MLERILEVTPKRSCDDGRRQAEWWAQCLADTFIAVG